jgi:hypothetical protein
VDFLVDLVECETSQFDDQKNNQSKNANSREMVGEAPLTASSIDVHRHRRVDIGKVQAITLALAAEGEHISNRTLAVRFSCSESTIMRIRQDYSRAPHVPHSTPTGQVGHRVASELSWNGKKEGVERDAEQTEMVDR